MESVLCFVGFAGDGFGAGILNGIVNLTGIFYNLADGLLTLGVDF